MRDEVKCRLDFIPCSRLIVRENRRLGGREDFIGQRIAQDFAITELDQPFGFQKFQIGRRAAGFGQQPIDFDGGAVLLQERQDRSAALLRLDRFADIQRVNRSAIPARASVPETEQRHQLDPLAARAGRGQHPPRHHPALIDQPRDRFFPIALAEGGVDLPGAQRPARAQQFDQFCLRFGKLGQCRHRARSAHIRYRNGSIAPAARRGARSCSTARRRSRPATAPIPDARD